MVEEAEVNRVEIRPTEFMTTGKTTFGYLNIGNLEDQHGNSSTIFQLEYSEPDEQGNPIYHEESVNLNDGHPLLKPGVIDWNAKTINFGAIDSSTSADRFILEKSVNSNGKSETTMQIGYTTFDEQGAPQAEELNITLNPNHPLLKTGVIDWEEKIIHLGSKS
jgi:hypothetical protein